MSRFPGNTRGSVGRCTMSLVSLVVLVCASGANCPGFLDTYSPVMPRVLPATPTMADVMNVVNTNTSRIQSMYTTDAEIYIPGALTCAPTSRWTGRGDFGCGPARY